MALLAFLFLYGLALLVLAVVHTVVHVNASWDGTSQPSPKIAGCWFTLAVLGSLVILGVNGQPQTSTTLGTIGPLALTSASPHLDAWCWLAPLAAAILGALALWTGRRG
jgi:hypothetical protein